MRRVFSVTTMAVCGGLAALFSLAEGTPTHAAIMPPPIATDLAVPASAITLVGHSSGGVEAHFAAANVTHDGHLTRDQAERSDWTRIVKHFDEIDTDHKGWISVSQIHDFNRSHRRHRKATEG